MLRYNWCGYPLLTIPMPSAVQAAQYYNRSGTKLASAIIKVCAKIELLSHFSFGFKGTTMMVGDRMTLRIRNRSRLR